MLSLCYAGVDIYSGRLFVSRILCARLGSGWYTGAEIYSGSLFARAFLSTNMVWSGLRGHVDPLSFARPCPEECMMECTLVDSPCVPRLFAADGRSLCWPLAFLFVSLARRYLSQSLLAIPRSVSSPNLGSSNLRCTYGILVGSGGF